MMGYTPGVNSAIVDRIMSANPILEAFGNAMTLRNNNSSRFGKFIKVHYDGGFAIRGCTNSSFLLEKARVTHQNHGERNFHIFYEFLLGSEREMLERLHLSHDPSLARYRYMCGGLTEVGGDHGDKKHFKEILAAFDELGFSADEVSQIWSILAAILKMGNVDFVPSEEIGDDGCIVDPEAFTTLAEAAELLGIGGDELAKRHCEERITTSRTEIIKRRTVEAACACRDATSRQLYDLLFRWLIARINEATSSEDSSQFSKFIGILDIFGFEIFEHNGFEQLCINFANEVLQGQFSHSVFDGEAKIYSAEGLDDVLADFQAPDNTGIIETLSRKRTGIFLILDEERKLPRGSSRGFFQKVIKEHCSAKSPSKKRSKGSSASRSNDTVTTRPGTKWFCVKHFAGDVKYYYEGFFEANRDDFSDNVKDLLMEDSSLSIVRGMFASKGSEGNQQEAAKQSPRKSRRGKKAQRTVAAKFRENLSQLLNILDSTSNHFIRCIKSNPQQRALYFDDDYIL